MRSTNIVIFLVLLNAAAGVAGAIAPTPIDPSTNIGGEVDQTSSVVADREVNQPSADEITGSFFGVGKLIQQIDGLVFAGPNMLVALGMPSLIGSAIKGVFVFVVAFDVAEAVTGRRLS
jgi:hypothetical protein